MRGLCPGGGTEGVHSPQDDLPNAWSSVESERFPLVMMHDGDGCRSSTALEKGEPVLG